MKTTQTGIDKYRFSFEVCFDCDRDVEGSQLLEALQASVLDIVKHVSEWPKSTVDDDELEHIERSCCVERLA